MHWALNISMGRVFAQGAQARLGELIKARSPFSAKGVLGRWHAAPFQPGLITSSLNRLVVGLFQFHGLLWCETPVGMGKILAHPRIRHPRSADPERGSHQVPLTAGAQHCGRTPYSTP